MTTWRAEDPVGERRRSLSARVPRRSRSDRRRTQGSLRHTATTPGHERLVRPAAQRLLPMSRCRTPWVRRPSAGHWKTSQNRRPVGGGCGARPGERSWRWQAESEPPTGCGESKQAIGSLRPPRSFPTSTHRPCSSTEPERASCRSSKGRQMAAAITRAQIPELPSDDHFDPSPTWTSGWARSTVRHRVRPAQADTICATPDRPHGDPGRFVVEVGGVEIRRRHRARGALAGCASGWLQHRWPLTREEVTDMSWLDEGDMRRLGARLPCGCRRCAVYSTAVSSPTGRPSDSTWTRSLPTSSSSTGRRRRSDRGRVLRRLGAESL
jgi:hypothetical protein